MTKRILVTGGAGFIGASLSNRLSEESDVTAVDNLKSGNWGRCNSKVKKLQLDLVALSYQDYCELLSNFDDVYHLSAVKLHNQENSLEDILLNNAVASGRLFDAAGFVGVKNVFFSSSLYVYGSMGPKPMSEEDLLHPNTYYGTSKHFGELALSIAAKKYGFRALTARFFFIYGPNQFSPGGYKSVIVKNFENAIRKKPFEIVGDGRQSLDYVYIDDCVEIINRLMNTDFSGVVNVASGKPTSILSIVDEMQRITDMSEVVYSEKDFTHGSARFGSNTKLQEIIGNYSFLDIAEGLRRTWRSTEDPEYHNV